MISPWLMGGMDVAGGLAGSLLGQNNTSPLMGAGQNLMNTGAENLGNAYGQYGQYLGMVNPYIGPAFQQGQQALQNYGNTLTQYSNPADYMNAARQTQLAAQGLGGAVPSNIGWNATNYLGAANNGLFGANSGATPSTLAGATAYGQGVLNQQQASTLANIGQQAMNAPLQFGGQAANLYTGNAANLMGEGQSLNGAMGSIGAQQFGMGQNEYQTGLGATQAYNQALSGGIQGMLGGLGGIYGFQNAMGMMQKQQGGGGGIAYSGGNPYAGNAMVPAPAGYTPYVDPTTNWFMNYGMNGQ